MRTQLPVSMLMAYATYLAAICPCKRTLACHLKAFFLATGCATALVVHENGFL